MDDPALQLRVIELLAARLCHDLVSPVSAVNNGLELLSEAGTQADELGLDALALAIESGQRAAGLLKAYRVAYGTGASGLEGGYAELRELAEAYLSHRRCVLDWQTASGNPRFDPAAHLDPAWGGLIGEGEVAFCRRLGKLLLNLVLLSELHLPRGGAVAVETRADGVLVVAASGQDARPLNALTLALGGKLPVEELDPKSIQALHTALVARGLGLAASLVAEARVEIRVTLA